VIVASLAGSLLMSMTLRSPPARFTACAETSGVEPVARTSVSPGAPNLVIIRVTPAAGILANARPESTDTDAVTVASVADADAGAAMPEPAAASDTAAAGPIRRAPHLWINLRMCSSNGRPSEAGGVGTGSTACGHVSVRLRTALAYESFAMEPG
jgi:hypothetical protein